jgi:pimeloyl-ACP methyl ester carboxylesterase
VSTVVFVHGAWVTPLCWERFIPFFEARGHRCLAPPWPWKDRPVEDQRRSPAPELAHLGVAEIVAHYERVVRGLSEPPLLVGHSFGGLFVQMLLDRGLGRAGVAIDSAPPAGIPVYQWSALRSNLGVLLAPFGWRRVVRPSFGAFRYAFVHTLGPAEQRAAYERYVVPETRRIFFQAAQGMVYTRGATRVAFANSSRPPLLLIAGSDDRIVPASLNLANYRRYRFSPARTDFKVFPGRTHAIILQPGWEEVAQYAAEWLERS